MLWFIYCITACWLKTEALSWIHLELKHSFRSSLGFQSLSWQTIIQRLLFAAGLLIPPLGLHHNDRMTCPFRWSCWSTPRRLRWLRSSGFTPPRNLLSAVITSSAFQIRRSRKWLLPLLLISVITLEFGCIILFLF